MFSDPSGMSAKKAIVNGWNYLRYAGSSIIEWGVKGDFVANPNGWNTVWQTWAGFIPIYWQWADIRDTWAAWKNCSGLWWCLGSLSLAGLGYIPGIGDLCKAGARWVKSTGIILDLKQLSKKIKHAPDFWLDSTKPNSTNLEKFKLAIEEHIDSPQSQKIEWTYRWKNVTHYFNEITWNNVIINSKGEFISWWKLNSKLIENLLGRNSLWGF